MKTTAIIVTVLCFFISFIPVSSQKEANNWYFGRNAGITFNTTDGAPIAVTDGALNTVEGCAAISDRNGVLLFYTDGMTVWNRNHEIMENGTGMKGHWSSKQAAIIIPKPGDSLIYYIFTSDEGGYEDPPNAGINYTTVNMSNYNGLGAVVEKNIQLRAPSTEQLAAVRHRNGKDVWAITHDEASSLFRSFLVTAFGVVKESVNSNVGKLYTIGDVSSGTSFVNIGSIRISPDGRRLFANYFPVYSKDLDANARLSILFDFDNAAGMLSNAIELDTYRFSSSNAEFSPDGNKLYVAIDFCDGLGGYSLYQYDLSVYSESEINDSKTLIANAIDGKLGSANGMQLGPDGKIYIVDHLKRRSLRVINKPNRPGRECDFDEEGIFLSNKKADYELPNFISSYFFGIDAYSNSPLCAGETLRLFTSDVDSAEYSWEGPNGFLSGDKFPLIEGVSASAAGLYKVTIRDLVSGKEYIDSTEVTVYPSPAAEIIPSGPLVFCDGGAVTLAAAQGEGWNCLWSTGQTTPEIVAAASGTYTLYVENEYGCRDSAAAIVKVNENLEIEIDGLTEFCEGAGSTLRAYPVEESFSYLWSTGATTPEIEAAASGTYTLYAEDANGCGGADTVVVTVWPPPEGLITPGGEVPLCGGGALTLKVEPYNEDYYYNWSTEAVDVPEIEVTSPGMYMLKIRNPLTRCVSFDTVIVKTAPPPQFSVAGDLSLCVGESGSLTTDAEFAAYLWSTGETSREIEISAGGKYWVEVADSNGCVGADTVVVEVFPNPAPAIIGVKPFIKGGSITLSVDADFASYLWSTGTASKDITISSGGEYWVEVTDVNGCVGADTVAAELVDIGIIFEGIGVAFDPVCVGGRQDISVSVSNATGRELTVAAVGYKRPGGAFAAATVPAAPYVLPSGGGMRFDMSFAPPNAVDYADSLIIETGGNLTGRFAFQSTGTGLPATVVSLPDLTGPIGAKGFCIPLRARLNWDTDTTIFMSYAAEIGVDARAFYPDAGGAIIDGERIATLTGGAPIGRHETELTSFCGAILLTSGPPAALRFISFAWDAPACTDLDDGSLYGEEICVRPLRIVQSFTPLSLSINPNPASVETTVYYELPEKSCVNIELYNSIGKRITTLEKGEREPGLNSVKFNTSAIPNGAYFIILNAGGRYISSPVYILK